MLFCCHRHRRRCRRSWSGLFADESVCARDKGSLFCSTLLVFNVLYISQHTIIVIYLIICFRIWILCSISVSGRVVIIALGNSFVLILLYGQLCTSLPLSLCIASLLLLLCGCSNTIRLVNVRNFFFVRCCFSFFI